MNIKLQLWYFLHDKLTFWSNLRQSLHILKLEKSKYYPECEQFYSKLDVKDKVVIDVGSDFGTSPMYFLKRGAKKVIGFSMDKQYFKDYRYKHVDLNQPDALQRTIIGLSLSLSELKSIVLKCDCEGCEWNFTIPFIESFDDWIIACHEPIKNQELLDYIKSNGELIGKQEGSEFGIYKKVK